VIDEKDFQKRVQRIGGLVQDLETIADPAARAAAKELVQLLMDLHGTGLERILEIVFQSGDSGAHVIDELGQDPLVSSLLVLYGLHPDDMQTRVERKLKEIGSKVHKMGAAVELVSVNNGDVRLRASVEGHTCGSTTQAVRATIEDAIYEAAPDLTSLVVEGLDGPTSSGFVTLEALLGNSLPSSSTLDPTAALGSEGMD
jgi:Fe-S cluster biogenesis protein NfuA